MTYLSHTGEFTTVTGGEIDATTFFDPVYGATGLTLEVISTVPSVPQVCIASPADGLVVNSGTSVTFQGTASDPEDGDLSASIVWTSNIQAGEFSGAGFTTGGLADGVHTITATVTDSNSNTSTDSITVTVSDTLPVLSIDGPADGSVFNSGSIVTLQGTATDAEDGDISEDIVWTSDLQVGLATGSSLSTDLLINGVHTITATITDFLGNVVVDTITVTVSNTVPTVSITSPIDGATFASEASVDFSGTADDAEDGDISATIVWTSDQQPGSSFTGAGFSTNLLSDGVHVITATVTDALGNAAADSVSITVGP